MADEVVKIDSELMREIEKLIEKEKYKYSSKKQVVNLSIIEFLKLHSLNKSSKKREI